MTRTTAAVLGAIAMVAVSYGAGPPAQAQNQGTWQTQAQPQGPSKQAPAKGQPPQKAPAAKTPPGAEPAPPPQADAGGLRGRVEHLEELMVEMQVTIGTLESLARSGGVSAAARPSSAGLGDAAGRVEALETQVEALRAQVEQLTLQLRAAEARAAQGGATPRPDPRSSRTDPRLGVPGATGAGTAGANSGADEDDPINRLLTGGDGARAQGAPRVATGPGPSPAAKGPATAPMPPLPSASPPQPASTGDGSAKQMYDTAYEQLRQQDFGAAEVSFDEFLRRFPNDALSGSAQFWLGETYFVRGQYRQAANAFLKGYQTYGKSPKAPDSLLKLAMSLERLGQKDAACASFSELDARFPAAPPHVKARAVSERQRIGCG